MHIAAVMAVLEVWDLDRDAKTALLVVACRADQYTALAHVSIRRVAADMKVDYHTAARALQRAVDSGYLTVDKSPRQRPIWQVQARSLRVSLRVSDPNLRENRTQPRALRNKKDIYTRDAASLADTASGVAGEKPATAARRTTVDAKGYLYVVEDQ